MKHLLTASAIACAAATPALAQGPICGGISLVGEWVGGNAGASDLTATTAPFQADGQVPIAGHLVRMFSLSAPAQVRIDVAAIPAGDPYIAVVDAGGTEVASDDDSGGDFAARVDTNLAPGTYCLAARSYESGMTDVSVRIGLAETFGDAPAPTPPPATAGAIGAGCFEPGMARLGDGLSMADLAATLSAGLTVADTPALGFSLAAPSTLTVRAVSDAGDPLIRLLDVNGAVLDENDDHDGLNARIDRVQPLGPGDYCIEIEDLNGADNPITVSLEAYDAAAERLRSLNAAEFAPIAGDPVTVTDLGTVQTALLRDLQVTGDATWLTFDVPGGGLLLTEVVGNGLDPAIVLFDRVGRRVGENDDGPDGLDSFLATRLLPGRYTLAVRLIDETSSGTVRLLVEHYVPAE